MKTYPSKMALITSDNPMVQVRLMGPEKDCRAMLAVLKTLYNVVSVSRPYANYDGNVRYYVCVVKPD